MRARLAFLALAAALLGGCGGTTPSTTSSTTVTTQSQLKLQVYFFRGNALVPVVVRVPKTQAVATAALEQLLAGAPAGYRSELPANATLKSVAVSKGTATAHISGTLSRDAEAQVVYTLTQFSTVTSVDGQTRLDFADLTPLAPIFIASPARGATVSSPVRVSGTADVFEGTFSVDIWSGGKKLRTETITASAGSGTRGRWGAIFNLPAGAAKLVFYEPSAENGQPLHTTELDLNVQ